MTEPRPRVLVVDDESQMVSIVAFALETQGFETMTARNAEDAWRLIQNEAFDLLVLDVMLPGASGVQLCRRVRTHSDVPVILLTARGEEADRLNGLLAGADDYVTKPFSPRELALRAAAVVRRTRGRAAASDVIVNGALVIDQAADTVTWGARTLRLTDMERRLLIALARRAGEVVPWRDLLNEVWFTGELAGGRDMIKTTVYRLRQHLGEAGDELIVAIRGVGYRMPRLETPGGPGNADAPGHA